MLTLPIKKKWLDMILSGEKKEEYREIKPYWNKRFKSQGYPDTANMIVKLRAGYRKNAPAAKVIVIVTKGTGREEWGAVPGVVYYKLAIKEISK